MLIVWIVTIVLSYIAHNNCILAQGTYDSYGHKKTPTLSSLKTILTNEIIPKEIRKNLKHLASHNYEYIQHSHVLVRVSDNITFIPCPR